MNKTKSTKLTADRLPENGDEKTKLKGAVTKETRITVSIKQLDLERKLLELTIVGTSPLVVHAWGAKALKEILGKQRGEASKGKEHKDPVADFKSCFYHMPESDGGGYGMKSTALKNCAVTAANDVELQKADMRRAFHVLGDLVKIDRSAGH